jgi:hypothetical protein
MLILRLLGCHLTQRSIFEEKHKIRDQELHLDYHQQQHSFQQIIQYVTLNFESIRGSKSGMLLL